MRGFLSFMILKLLGKRSMSGEEISQEIKKRKGTKPSPGTVYPALKSLSKSGFIEIKNGAGKVKKYSLTKKGHKELNSATRKFCTIFYDMKEDFNR